MTATGNIKSCDCCKEPAQHLDEIGLCFVCGCVQTFASMIEETTDLDGDAAVDLASDLVEDLRSRILERLLDRGLPANDFLAEIQAGMERVDSPRAQ